MTFLQFFNEAVSGESALFSEFRRQQCEQMEMHQKCRVTVSKVADYEPETLKSALVALLEPLGGMKAFVSKGERVLLKPNMLSAKNPSSAVTTHPAIVKAVADMALAEGCMVMIGDSPGTGSFQRVAEISGIAAAARESGCALVPFDNVQELHGDGIFKRINLASTYMAADKVINLPKLKTHEMMTMTCAVKNLFGAVTGKEKAVWHLKAGVSASHFARLLLEIYLAKKPALNIVDAVVAMEGDGPGSGDPVNVGRLLAGENPVAVDFVAARLVGIPPERLHIEREAAEMGLSGSRIEDIELLGIDEEIFSIRPFRLPEASGPQFGIPRFLAGRFRRYLTPLPVPDKKSCTLCGICLDACPPGAISVKKEAIEIEAGLCISCWCCRKLCPHSAMKVRKSLLLKCVEAFVRVKNQTSSSSCPSGISR